MKRKSTQSTFGQRFSRRRKELDVFDDVLRRAFLPSKLFGLLRGMLRSGEEMDIDHMVQMLDELEKNYDDFRLCYVDMKQAREYQKKRCEDAWKEVYLLRKKISDDFNNTMIDLTQEDGKLVKLIKKWYPEADEKQIDITKNCVKYNAVQRYRTKMNERKEVLSLYVLAGITLLSKML
jgi:hypothetical protein